jgi:hypothetical protein
MNVQSGEGESQYIPQSKKFVKETKRKCKEKERKEKY